MLEELAFTGTWRRYQRMAIDAFERDRAAGRRRTHIVAPPGSGKTLLGVELLRRVGRRSLVLAPNSAIQMQWPRAVRQFTTDAQVAGTEPGFPITCLSYQSLAQLDDPEVALGRVAALRWAADRAAATGAAVDEIEREVERFEGEAADRRQREIGRITAAIKSEIARGEHAGVQLASCCRPRRASACAGWPPPRSARSCSTSATTSPRCGATSCAPCSTSSAATRT